MHESLYQKNVPVQGTRTEDAKVEGSDDSD